MHVAGTRVFQAEGTATAKALRSARVRRARETARSPVLLKGSECRRAAGDGVRGLGVGVRACTGSFGFLL